MDYLANLLAPTAWPSGVWESIIKWFAGVGSIGVAIILLTICLKVLMFPLDFWQRKVTRKMTAQQTLMQPELEQIKKKYGNNQQIMQQKQAELYKKYNMSPTNSCLAMLVYMIVTMVVFFTLFAGLGNISRSQINYEYYTIEQTYRTTYKDNISNPNVIEISQQAAAQKYEEVKQGFLVIKNVWRPDNWSSVFPKSDEFIKSTATSFKAYKHEASGVTYIIISTNSAVLEDVDGNKYVEPYVDLQGNIYALYDVTETATNPTTITIKAQDGDLTYNVIYSSIVSVYENVDLGISYYYLTQEATKTYKVGENTYILPYVKDNTVFVSSATELTEVEVDGKTYNVDATKTIDDIKSFFNATEQSNMYAKTIGADAVNKFRLDYDLVTASINQKYQGQWNGYLVLIVLSGVITFLSSWLSTAGIRTKDKKGNQIKGAKPKPTMGIILSLVMIFFTFSYTSAFAIYIITNSLTAMLFTYLINIILNKLEDKKEKADTTIPDYVRK